MANTPCETAFYCAGFACLATKNCHLYVLAFSSPHFQLIDLQSNSLVHDLSGSPFPLLSAVLLDDVLLCLDTANHLLVSRALAAL